MKQLILIGAMMPGAAWVNVQDAPTGQSADHRIQTEEFLRQQVRAVLDALDGPAIDPVSDDYFTAMSKYDAIKKLLHQHERQALKVTLQASGFALNYAGFLYESSPRLTGNVLRVGENRNLKTIADALAEARPGDVIALDAGEYSLGAFGGRRGPPLIPDLAIVGEGRDRTSIQAEEYVNGIQAAERMLIEGFALDCNNRSFVFIQKRLEGGSAARFRDCKSWNYNSAGGANAVGGNTAVLMFNRCEFEGLIGSSYHPERGNNQRRGAAFDLRGDNWLYVRQSQFIENDEIERVTYPAVFDGCISMTTHPRGEDGINTYASGYTFLRDNRAQVRNTDHAIPFTHTTDDLVVVEYAAGLRDDAPEKAVELAKRLQLHRNLRYWIGMMFHDDAARRDIAARRVEALTGQQVDFARVTFDELPAQLRSRFGAYAEAGRLANWHDQNHERLTWDDAAGRYELNEAVAGDETDEQ